MFRLSREVRFAINRDHFAGGRARHDQPVTNGFAGWPSLSGSMPGSYFALAVTLRGELDPDVQYLLNIKHVDAVVRDHAISSVAAWALADSPRGPNALIASLFGLLDGAWPSATLESLRLSLSPHFSVCANREELPMTRLSQKFEFSASHRLHNPAMGDDENRAMYGKCNNPHGHGHNYELQVTLVGDAGPGGTLVYTPAFEEIVAETVIRPFDHKNLNLEVPEFRELIPSVENIARVIYQRLRPKFASGPGRLGGVTVWETPKTWCEYSE